MSVYYNEGRYSCEIITQGLNEAKSSGNMQIVWRIKVLETEAGEQLPSQYERTIYRTITENTIPYILEDLRTLGYEHDNFRQLDPSQPDCQNFKGKLIIAFCQHEDDQKGGTREKWGIANDSAFEVKPMESAKLRQLDNLFGRHLKELKGSRASTPRPAPTPIPAGVSVDDSDVPF